MKALSLTVQMLWPMLKCVCVVFFCMFEQTDRLTGQKLYAPNLLIWGHRKKKIGEEKQLDINFEICQFLQCLLLAE